jgi:hypothetical protein
MKIFSIFVIFSFEVVTFGGKLGHYLFFKKFSHFLFAGSKRQPRLSALRFFIAE